MSDIMQELNLYIDVKPNSITMSHEGLRKIKYIYKNESDFLFTLGLLEEIKIDTAKERKQAQIEVLEGMECKDGVSANYGNLRQKILIKIDRLKAELKEAQE